jgi:hypothetical protein
MQAVDRDATVSDLRCRRGPVRATDPPRSWSLLSGLSAWGGAMTPPRQRGLARRELVHDDECHAADGSQLDQWVGRREPMVKCLACGRAGAAPHPQTAAEPGPPAAPVARYYLGACIRCEVEIWTPSRRPQVPLCAPCRLRAERNRIAEQRARRAALEYTH